jgi:hypothetical protein
MAAFKKFFKDLKNEHVLGIVGLVFLVFALYQYSNNKNTFQLGMSNGMDMKSEPTILSNASKKPLAKSVVGATQANGYAPYNGVAQSVSNSATTSSAMNKPLVNPSDLLPSDTNSVFAALNPVTNMKNVNLLNSRVHNGINTQGGSLRNANLQLRSEPPNPRTNTNCPWNISTIETDKFRKELEIGTGS